MDMAFSELELQRIKRDAGVFCAKRSPAHLRDKLRHDYRVERQSVILFEVRPQWNDPNTFLKLPYAKLTYIRSRNIWKLYWRRADQKFHRYDPKESAPYLAELIAEIDRDPHGCFFG